MISQYSAEYVQGLRTQIDELKAALDEQTNTLEDLRTRHDELIATSTQLLTENKNLRAWQQAAINEASEVRNG